jgi:hypothetical protein
MSLEVRKYKLSEIKHLHACFSIFFSSNECFPARAVSANFQLSNKEYTFIKITFIMFIVKKNLKIPKGFSEFVYRRKTYNTMAKRKSTKGQATIYKTCTKLKIEQHEPH